MAGVIQTGIRAFSRVVVNQGGSPTATVIAAAAAGLKHKVVGCVLSPAGGGISAVRFTFGAVPGTDLMGEFRVPGGSHPGLVWTGGQQLALVETPAGSQLNVVSTGSNGFAGVVIFITEP